VCDELLILGKSGIRHTQDYGHHAGEEHFVQLVERLKSVEPGSAQWRPRHDILRMTEGRNDYDHPRVGSVIVERSGIDLHSTTSGSDSNIAIGP
jgi:hypothetical protein